MSFSCRKCHEIFTEFICISIGAFMTVMWMVFVQWHKIYLDKSPLVFSTPPQFCTCPSITTPLKRLGQLGWEVTRSLLCEFQNMRTRGLSALQPSIVQWIHVEELCDNKLLCAAPNSFTQLSYSHPILFLLTIIRHHIGAWSSHKDGLKIKRGTGGDPNFKASKYCWNVWCQCYPGYPRVMDLLMFPIDLPPPPNNDFLFPTMS